MNGERSYAAIHLGDGSISLLLASGSRLTRHEFTTRVTMHEGTLSCLDGEAHSVGPTECESLEADGIENFPWAFVDDPDTIVGSTLVPTEDVFLGVVHEALGRAGAVLPVDLLDIACPSSWGPVRRNVVRRAVAPVAREISTMDIATAAARALGERAPEFAVVVELGELQSIVSSLSLRDGADGSDDDYVRSGRWVALGRRDLDLDPSAEVGIREAAAGHITARSQHELADGRLPRPGRASVDVFLVDTTRRRGGTAVPADTAILADTEFRVHRMRGPDVTDSMAARVGIAEPMYPLGPPSPDSGLPDVEPVGPGPSTLSYVAPSSNRAAAWLDEVHSPQRAERHPAFVVGAVVALALSVAVVVGLRISWNAPTSVTTQVRQADAVSDVDDAVAPLGGTTDNPSDDGRASITEADDPSESIDAAALPELPAERFSQGRVSIELPETWSERPDTGRVDTDRALLIPADAPDRRIVLTTVELADGVSFDEVADDLAGQLAARGDGPIIDGYTPAMDFGGRVGISYMEFPDDFSAVKWHIFVEDGLQIGIGCQSATGAEEFLSDDCARAVSTLQVSPP